MIYQATITTPINTAIANHKQTTLDVNKGLVYKVEIFFPAGCAGLCGCMICDAGFQAWPTTPFEYFRGDDLLIGYDDTYLKNDAPYTFDIFTYNLDDTYPHTIDVRIGLVTKEIFMARFLPTYTYDYFLKMIDALAVMQQQERAAIIAKGFQF